MSLHLANLSPQIRKDELEREFRRFGRCTVQLKDGYGFAVYDFCKDAEKALRTLKGRKICGQSVYLSWSNKQPKQVQRLARASRPHDMSYGKTFNRGGNFRGSKLSRSHGDHTISESDKRLMDRSRERHQSGDDRQENFNIKSSELLHYDQVEGGHKESGHVDFEHNEMDFGRWGEQVDHCQDVTDFDRYDPESRENNRSPMENKSRENKRKAYNRKRSERDDQIEETRDDKKSRPLTLSHRHSDRSSPEFDTLSRSRNPLVGTSSHYASSRSNSKVHMSNSKSLQTKSRSRSRSPSSSFSISIGRSLRASPNKSQISLNGFSEGALTSPSKEVLTNVEVPSSPLLDNDDKKAAGMKMAAQKPRKTEENTNAFETTCSLEPTSSKVRAGSNLNTSGEEMYRVLKHYGLKNPENNEHIDLEGYFGSSKLWPWEMIYYRRLKTGSISVENYARRVVQNKEFNIADKYIRSSSGWNELIE